MSTMQTVPVKPPPFRKLRGYAFDPSLSIQLDTVDINVLTYKIPWESLVPNPMQPGARLPFGEYVEIIDYDPPSALFYPPVNLDDPKLIAQEGLDPSVSSPQFHQQMVYAVVMTTIKNFEFALGRKIQWADHIYTKAVLRNGQQKQKTDSSFVEKLRIYPHALRQANAYYNPDKKALLFGYFPAQPANVQLQIPGEIVFTCLSHDIISHETTHAILDGLHRRYTEPTNVDTRAFHEAFADLVALFQHFTYPGVLKQQIANTKGNLSQQNLLGQLAQQFGKARGHYGSLRDAIGFTDEEGGWHPLVPTPDDYQTKMEFHDRGAILVAAIFDAFLNIYKRRISSVLRIASGGTGKLPDGELHPDLVDRLAELAADTASRILHICVRALDYSPAVDINFGDYLRALITADKDMVLEDPLAYRIAFIEAFQKRGIFPKRIKSLSVESLCYQEPEENALPEAVKNHLIEFLKEYKDAIAYESNRRKIHGITKGFINGSIKRKNFTGLHKAFSRKLLSQGPDPRKKFGELTGLFFPDTREECEKEGFVYKEDYGTAKYEIGNLWLASRVTPDKRIVNHVIVTLLQRRGIIAEVVNGVFSVKEYYVPGTRAKEPGMFEFRGSATFIFDLDANCLKYVIKKSIHDKERMEQQFRIKNNLVEGSEPITYFTESALSALSGPFSFMHTYS